MTRTLSLDLSSKAGWAILDTKTPFQHDAEVSLVSYGQLSLPTVVDKMGRYPWSFKAAADNIATQVSHLFSDTIDYVVIEVPTLGKQRRAQQILEWIHKSVLDELVGMGFQADRVAYITPSGWRSHLGIKLTSSDRANNKVLKAAKRRAEESGKKLDKKTLGVKGKVGTKHLSVRWVNENFGTDFKMKHNDITDAIALGVAFLRGAEWYDGK